MRLFRKQKSVEHLPKFARFFTLPDIILLPQTQLPLNIFEKKYIAMVDDAMATDRLIGIIQPLEQSQDSKLHKVGCIGRITSFQEAKNGQYHITILGLCRFELVDEINNNTAFRQGQVNYNDFDDDFTKPTEQRQKLINRQLLIKSIKDMLLQMNLEIDWGDLADTPNEMLVNAISMTSPFQVAEKQALLEAPTVADRAELLITLSQISLTSSHRNNGLLQ